ncbi:hypothetical protein OsI_12915 [Oryza sativa Indica Group]|uniref:Expressed protein n=3 Tax=Oryza sativa TaxID=4530 RepID=Q75HA4_ORYSJ|nr:expressed protein [Oryza sativa Japonica Group]ABF98075.1 expressed protein [Oryza sativa Japonica Group]EEC75880.1 hypothetical protein OsI_12915 [Oryza sativa Indica Group]BAF12763.1 Os03g0666800 [Oryza sativa Japonica Group]BAG90015.1 unnamed protein product [Oryza sativa Japonica Group]|eukprot:NP_001050849.1 Os03g0666800 [Oryza sativa Japonica Group]
MTASSSSSAAASSRRRPRRICAPTAASSSTSSAASLHRRPPRSGGRGEAAEVATRHATVASLDGRGNGVGGRRGYVRRLGGATARLGRMGSTSKDRGREQEVTGSSQPANLFFSPLLISSFSISF